MIKPSFTELIEAATHVTGFSPELIAGKSQAQSISNTRQIVALLAKELRSDTLSYIGSQLNRHHTSILNGHRRITKLSTEPEIIELKRDIAAAAIELAHSRNNRFFQCHQGAQPGGETTQSS